VNRNGGGVGLISESVRGCFEQKRRVYAETDSHLASLGFAPCYRGKRGFFRTISKIPEDSEESMHATLNNGA
jgi:hypothetical protein